MRVLLLGWMAVTCVSCVRAGETYTNPVLSRNFADPGVIEEGGLWYAVSTGAAADGSVFEIIRSADLVKWTHIGYVFSAQTRPRWGVGRWWAPEIHRIGPLFVVFHAAADKTGRLCIGAAVAHAVAGPYTPLPQPLVRNAAAVNPGFIDPTYHEGYLIWKLDGNSVGQRCAILAQQLVANGTAFAPNSVRRTLLTSTLGWEHGIVEAPWVIHVNETYYLFYSGASTFDDSYAVGVARSHALLGPYVKWGGRVVATSTAPHPLWGGPGHCSVVDN